MNCPICSSPDHRLVETKATDRYCQRIRVCQSCEKAFFTIALLAKRIAN